MMFLLRYRNHIAVILGMVVFMASLVLYGYRWGASSVEAEYDALRAAQRVNASAASEGYQDYRKRADMTKIRKELADEIKHNACRVADDKRLRLYQAAGVRIATP